MKNLITSLLLFFPTISLLGQSFSVFNLNTNDFPIVKAKFYAFDSNEDQIR